MKKFTVGVSIILLIVVFMLNFDYGHRYEQDITMTVPNVTYELENGNIEIKEEMIDIPARKILTKRKTGIYERVYRRD